MGKIVSETAAHSRYLTVFDRVVEFDRRASYTSSDADPPSAVSTRVSYDVVGHPRNDFKFAVVFPFHTSDATVTIVSEYCQGTNGRCVSLPTGGFDPTRHATLRDAAVAEQVRERYHDEDCLMLWFDFFNHDSARVVQNMRAFMDKVVPLVEGEGSHR